MKEGIKRGLYACVRPKKRIDDRSPMFGSIFWIPIPTCQFIAKLSVRDRAEEDHCGPTGQTVVPQM
jgi:hypothetical protein